MSETSLRRRWLGRGLIAAGAFALPLTASISYAVAQVPPAPPAPPAPEAAPLPPEAPDAHDGDERHVRTMVIRREGADGEPVVRQFTMGHPQPPQAPQPPQLNRQGEWNSEEFQAEMERFQAEMEQFRAEWTEEHGEDWAQWAQQHQAQALAMAEQARRMAPEVVHDCDGNDSPVRSSRTENGRTRIVICERRVNRMARSSLRNARESIARNPEISDEVRREILEDLDVEIERIERDDD